MKNFRSILLLLIFPTLSFAQKSFLSVGTIEAGGELSFNSSSVSQLEGSTTIFASSIYIGIMAAKGFELGFRPGFTIIGTSASSLKSLDLYFNPNYNFSSDDKVYPYLGFIVGHNSIEDDNESHSGLGIGGEGGLKCFLGETSLLLVKLEYLTKKYEDSTLKNFSLGLGFRFYFPSRTLSK
jgi:hypothetical protein